MNRQWLLVCIVLQSFRPSELHNNCRDDHKFVCTDGGCVFSGWRCDGYRDCQDGSDEDNCEHPPLCAANEWQCSDMRCIPRDWYCDGQQDCADGSDEIGCGWQQEEHCPDNMTFCANPGQCIPVEWICDGEVDCVGGQDEEDCPGSDTEILFSTTKGIYHLAHRHTNIIYDQHQHVISTFTVHSLTGDIYWYNKRQHAVFQYNTDTRHIKVILRGVVCEHISIDWLGNNIYCSGGNSHKIHACSIRPPSQCTAIVVFLHDVPSATALVPEKGLMFWTTLGTRPAIWKAWMTGRDKHIIISNGITWPTSLTVDTECQTIYWADSKQNVIETADFHGSSRQVLVMSNAMWPLSIVISEDYIFWSDITTGSIMRANKTTGNEHSIVKQNIQQLRRIALPKTTEKDVRHLVNHCDTSRKNCSHICLLAPGGATCACSEGMRLSPIFPDNCIGAHNVAKHLGPVVTKPRRRQPMREPPKHKSDGAMP